MGLFESNYKAMAKTEIEREIRELEERDKIAQSEGGLEAKYMECSSCIDFAEKIRLIRQQEADAFRKRLREVQVTQNAKHLYKTEYSDYSVDGFENPRERTARYTSMERVNAEIQQERAQSSADRINDKTEQRGKVASQPTTESGERTHG